VCFPYAGGNAVNFQPLARALKDSGLAVYAVELPGHDLVAESSGSGTSIDAESSGSGTSIESEKEPFVPTGQVVDQVTAEIGALLGSTGLKTVLLWGHSAGTAAALEAARRLTERGVTVGRVFLGAQLLGDVDVRRARIADLAGRTGAEIVAGLSGDGGYTGLA
jgi:surfactin synthase thioesterase subunit